MREFSKITPSMWRDKRFKALSSSDVRLLYLYCIACEHQNSAGAFRLPRLYACSDLGWPEQQYQVALGELLAKGLIIRDEATEEIYCPGWFSINPAMNKSHAQSIERRISELESDAVREAAETEFLQSQEEREARKSRRPANVQPINDEVSERLLSTRLISRGRA
ncbi:hypothetical protein CN172_26500 [Sinorhizobium meliloti]|uniref:hypothetical protein n=1 Tax=Rhizobium meliloti TaxID=382 RepID=UPI000FD86DF7|nr:hypothetical protein [Sinorhizobium meliloti]RVE97205.1 hypothetical protein CN232_22690 [Sinorhizobium meliloti]RVH40261.1 hypothetical protein CN208_25180 [Sinorhizobium meliloti]RVK07577.1 hypothetical protein CN172_26500 [Sinorhizobium meliloti]